MLKIPKTKIENKKNEYIFPLALKMKEEYENEDIELIISVLWDNEKEILKNRLLELKIEVKTPADYSVNLKIYKIIAVIVDKSFINSTKKNLILNK